jgi:hypothetical protein
MLFKAKNHWADRARAAEGQVASARTAKDGAYSERNRCVALLARLAIRAGWRVGVAQHPAEDATWEPDWRTIVFIELPTGQVSWHFHDSERALVAGLPAWRESWGGHTTEEKHRRMQSCLCGVFVGQNHQSWCPEYRP